MKWIISLVLILVLVYGVRSLVFEIKRITEKSEAANQPEAAAAPAGAGGMPAEWESSLASAKRSGHIALRKWLQRFGPFLSDPRKAEIELEYVVLLWPHDRDEARRIFNSVKARTAPGSPLYTRIQRLEKTYQ